MDFEYIRQALCYRFFVVVTIDGKEKIHTGNEFREDAEDALKECREIHPAAKIKSIRRVDGTALQEFYAIVIHG